MSTIDKASAYLELNLQECGREICIPDKAIVFSKKPYHLFHYVISGKGYFEINGQRYTLHKGMIFYIPPESDAKYKPDKEDPWTYVWLGFDGANANSFLIRASISKNKPVFEDNEKLNLKHYFEDIYSEYKASSYLNVVCLGLAYELFGTLLKTSDEENKNYTLTDSYVIFAKEFIDNNYQFDIKINDVANSVGVSPNYLTNIFHAKLGYSPKKYLTDVRMKKAELFLKTSKYKIKDISTMVGYKSQLHFSNEFKKYFSLSPQNYIKGEKDKNEERI